jgi:hypothetical protein
MAGQNGSPGGGESEPRNAIKLVAHWTCGGGRGRSAFPPYCRARVACEVPALLSARALRFLARRGLRVDAAAVGDRRRLRMSVEVSLGATGMTRAGDMC